jgi:parvulin-like peptidyl-prolyl isomerase
VRELPEVKKDTEPVLYEEAKKLQTGELSGVIKTADSLHVIKLKEYIPEKQLTFDQVKYAIEAGVRMRGRGNRMQEFESELKKGAKIEIIDVKGSK